MYTILDPSELIFRERFHYAMEQENGSLLLAQIHGYILGLKSIKTLIKNLNLEFKFTCYNFYNINY